MKYKLLFTAVIFSAGLIGVYSLVGFAYNPLMKMRANLLKQDNEQPVEKVYLQFDKPYYAAGDDIWFKTYVVSGNSHQLSAISGIVNVELIDARDSITQSVKLPLDGGIAHGDFALPDNLGEGTYRIRAYTNYMRNAGPEYFFNKAITIINAISSDNKAARPYTPYDKQTTGKTDLQFFPEGGQLVNGITAKVAFKALAPDGHGIDINGVIIDNRGNNVAQFTSTHLGMGLFQFTPAPGTSYHAQIINADGTPGNYPLPIATDRGYVLAADGLDPQNLLVKVTASGFGYSSNALTLVAKSGGKVYDIEKVVPGTTSYTLVIPKSKFPSGVLQLTLYAASGEPLNERLVFIHNPDQLNLNLVADQQVYAARQKVTITLKAQNGHNQPEPGNFSVAVIDETKVPVNDDTENNILANLLLTSDLKGNVEQPAYYFNHSDAKAAFDLDVLLLTQGYRSFEWKQIKSNSSNIAHQYLPEQALQISGTVLAAGSSRPVPNARVNLYDLDSIKFTRDTVTDRYGRFAFTNLTFDDSSRFIVQARTDRNKKNVDIKMDKLPPPATLGPINPANFYNGFTTDLAVYAQSSKQLYSKEREFGLGNHVYTLQEVTIREKKELFSNSANLNGPANADQIVLGKTLRDQGCVTFAECLQGTLVGVTFRNGVPYSTRTMMPMQLVVDGVYLDSNYLNAINYNDIEGIEILRDINYTAVYGSHGSNGLFLVTTRHGNDDEVYPEPIYGRGITTYYPKGYYKTREFYSPRYDKPNTNKALADLRTTIYWKPNLATGNDGLTTFSYFNAASKGTYRVVVEGIGNDGKLGRAVYRYNVE